MKLNIVKTRKIWFAISSLLVVVSILSLVVWRLNFGIDFTGGALLDVRLEQGTVDEVRSFMNEQGYADARVQTSEPGEYLIRLGAINEEQHQALLTELAESFGYTEEVKFDYVGPVVGQELAKKAIYAIVLCLVLIMLYITWAFRHVSAPVKSWKYGAVTILAAFHNVLIPVGVFSVLGHFFGYQVDSAFIAAILTILGYSINDTIVAIDRIRENLHDWSSSDSYEEVVNRSLNQTMTRSINTTVTVLFALLAVLFFGGETTKAFALALTIGVLVSAYASIFIAAPLLVEWEKRSK
ncbi:MAG: protein translocase subunit SecF [Patescibacteria group bacterium]